MIWDGFLSLVLISLCLAGWNVGLINSWRGPIAMLIATIATQQFYIDFGTWIAQQTLCQPQLAGFFGYTMMWLVIEIVTEIILGLVLTWNRKERPIVFDRIGGVILAGIRWAIICILPMMVMNQTPNRIPEPPKKEDGLINEMKLGVSDSGLLKFFAEVGDGLRPSIGSMVLSTKSPSFTPNWDKPKVELK